MAEEETVTNGSKKKDTYRPDLFAVLEAAGIDTSARGDANGRRTVSLRCLFHEDRGRPNFVVWLDNQHWTCFRCGIGGDVYDLVGRQVYGDEWANRDRNKFLDILDRITHMDIPPAPPVSLAKERNIAPIVFQVLERAKMVYHLSLVTAPALDYVREYLNGRGVDMETIRKLKIGYGMPGALVAELARLPIKALGHAEEAGLIFNGREFLHHRIIFPDIGQQGKVWGLIGRSTEKEATLRYLSLPGIPKSLYGLEAAQKHSVIILTESIMDRVNLIQMGFQGVAANGTMIAQYQIARLKDYPFIALLPQNDEPGRDAVIKWKTLIPQARLLDIPYRPREKDVNDLYLKRGPAACKELIREALTKAAFV